MDTFQKETPYLKANTELGLVFGYAIICKKEGEDYYDLHGDHIPEDSMLEASTGFAQSERIGGAMHAKDEDGNLIKIGDVVHTFPLTTEIAKAMEIEPKHTGLMIAMKPDNTAILQKVKDGVLGSFSIGGSRIEDVEVD